MFGNSEESLKIENFSCTSDFASKKFVRILCCQIEIFWTLKENQAKILEDFVMRSKFDPTATSQALFAPPSSEITGAAEKKNKKQYKAQLTFVWARRATEIWGEHNTSYAWMEAIKRQEKEVREENNI